jgi:ribose/xylose/arabinose/galactoside ABC-type transport system permease subunit
MSPSIRNSARRHPEGITIGLVILISLAFAVITQGGWVSIGNLQSISQVTAVLAIMAFGEAMVIATGEIDISVGSVSGIGALTFLGLAPTGGAVLRCWPRSYAGYLSAR